MCHDNARFGLLSVQALASSFFFIHKKIIRFLLWTRDGNIVSASKSMRDTKVNSCKINSDTDEIRLIKMIGGKALPSSFDYVHDTVSL